MILQGKMHLLTYSEIKALYIFKVILIITLFRQCSRLYILSLILKKIKRGSGIILVYIETV